MTITRLIGDIHGKVKTYKEISVEDFEGPTIQVGDFGVGFGQGDYWYKDVNSFHEGGNHRFIRGNHDNPGVCEADMVGYIPDGTVEGDVMFIGGAWSIDNPLAPPGWYRRTPGIDWWPEEECSDKQFEDFLQVYKEVRPRVMIAHTCPKSVATEMFWHSGLVKGPQYPNRTESWFDILFQEHQPKEWYFGHWHKTVRYLYGKTLFHCIGELDYVDVEL